MLGGKELKEGDFYMSSDGYKVFTEQYHLKRGYCCENGCRHCPYDFKKRKKSCPGIDPETSPFTV